MRYQTDKNYKPLKLSLAVKLSPLIFLAGAVIGSFGLGAVEGTAEGWNYESMEKQRALTQKFEEKYKKTLKTNYKINDKRIEGYLTNEKIQ